MTVVEVPLVGTIMSRLYHVTLFPISMTDPGYLIHIATRQVRYLESRSFNDTLYPGYHHKSSGRP